MSSEARPDVGGLGAPAKRGRPRKDPAGAGNLNGDAERAGGTAEPSGGTENPPERIERIKVIDPFNTSDSTDEPAVEPGADQPRKRRGRKPKGEQKEEAIQNLNSLLKIEQILVSSAFFMGNILAAPEFHMSEQQSVEIAEALRDIARLYPVGVSEKTIAWINLSFAVGGWAGPAMVAVAKRPRPQRVPTPIRQVPDAPAPQASPAAPQPPLPVVIDEAINKAKVPSELWIDPDHGGDDEG